MKYLEMLKLGSAIMYAQKGKKVIARYSDYGKAVENGELDSDVSFNDYARSLGATHIEDGSGKLVNFGRYSNQYGLTNLTYDQDGNVTKGKRIRGNKDKPRAFTWTDYQQARRTGDVNNPMYANYETWKAAQTDPTKKRYAVNVNGKTSYVDRNTLNNYYTNWYANDGDEHTNNVYNAQLDYGTHNFNTNNLNNDQIIALYNSGMTDVATREDGGIYQFDKEHDNVITGIRYDNKVINDENPWAYKIVNNDGTETFRNTDGSIYTPTSAPPITETPDPLKDKTDELLADEVIAGKYGTGTARRTALGDRYGAVQKIVNSRMSRTSTITNNNLNTITGLSTQSNTGNTTPSQMITFRRDPRYTNVLLFDTEEHDYSIGNEQKQPTTENAHLMAAAERMDNKAQNPKISWLGKMTYYTIPNITRYSINSVGANATTMLKLKGGYLTNKYQSGTGEDGMTYAPAKQSRGGRMGRFAKGGKIRKTYLDVMFK